MVKKRDGEKLQVEKGSFVCIERDFNSTQVIRSIIERCKDDVNSQKTNSPVVPLRLLFLF